MNSGSAGWARAWQAMTGPAWPSPSAMLVTYAGAGVLTALIVVAGGTGHPAAGLTAFAILAVIVAMHARPVLAPAIAVVAWLFDDGFLIGRHAVLSWHGAADGERLAILFAAAAAGAAIGAVARARTARHRRPGPAEERPAPADAPTPRRAVLTLVSGPAVPAQRER